MLFVQVLAAPSLSLGIKFHFGVGAKWYFPPNLQHFDLHNMVDTSSNHLFFWLVIYVWTIMKPVLLPFTCSLSLVEVWLIRAHLACPEVKLLMGCSCGKKWEYSQMNCLPYLLKRMHILNLFVMLIKSLNSGTQNQFYQLQNNEKALSLILQLLPCSVESATTWVILVWDTEESPR